MKKSILIKENKIIVLEDAAASLASQDFNILKGVKGILSGLVNISSGLLNTIGGAVGMLINIFNDKKFNQYLNNSVRRNEELDREFKQISSELGIDSNVGKLINMADPASGILKRISEISIENSYRDKGIFDDFLSIGKPIVDIPESAFTYLDNYTPFSLTGEEKESIRNKSDKLLGGSEGLVAFHNWHKKLSDEDKLKIDKFRLDNPNKRDRMDADIAEGNVKRVIRELKEILEIKSDKKKSANKKQKETSQIKDSTILIKNNRIVLYESKYKTNVDKMFNKIYDELNKESIGKAIEKISVNILTKKINKIKKESSIDAYKQISEKIEKTFENLENYLSGKTNELQGFEDFNKQKVEDDNNGKKSRLAKLICILNFLQKIDLNDTLTKEKEEVISKSNDKKEADRLLKKKKDLMNKKDQLKNLCEEKIKQYEQ